MTLRRRVEKAEQTARPKRTALFIISDGRASGRAWWRDNLVWKDLSKPEFEQLTAELKAEGVEIIAINLIGVHAKGQGIDGWGQAVEV